MSKENLNLLFVYGTLRRGFKNPWQKLLQRGADWLGPARITGFLYDLGNYPGAVSDPEGSPVTGDLYRLKGADAVELLLRLDEYEGDEYVRVPVVTELDSGEKTEAWFYNLKIPVKGLKRIFPADYGSYLTKFP